MKIIINGIETEYDDPIISYDDVAAFVAIEERWVPPLPLLSVTYHWRGDEDMSRSGVLSPRDNPIKVSDGMRFSAYRTGGS